MPRQTEEKKLLALLKRGDNRAFDRLYRSYSSPVYGKLLKLTGAGDIAEELLQEIFIRVWEKRHTINPELPFKPWLYRVAENSVFYYYRKLARDSRLQQRLLENFPLRYAHAEEDLYFKESRQLLQQAVARLSPQRRRVFELCRLEGRSYRQAAGILGVSVSTVSNQLVKATKLVSSYVIRYHKITILIGLAGWLR